MLDSHQKWHNLLWCRLVFFFSSCPSYFSISPYNHQLKTTHTPYRHSLSTYLNGKLARDFHGTCAQGWACRSPSPIHKSVRWQWMAAGSRGGISCERSTRGILLKHFYLHLSPLQEARKWDKEKIEASLWVEVATVQSLYKRSVEKKIK